MLEAYKWHQVLFSYLMLPRQFLIVTESVLDPLANTFLLLMVMGHTNSTQDLLLTLCSGIITGRVWRILGSAKKPIWVSHMQSKWPTCSTTTLAQLSIHFYSFFIFERGTWGWSWQYLGNLIGCWGLNPSQLWPRQEPFQLSQCASSTLF